MHRPCACSGSCHHQVVEVEAAEAEIDGEEKDDFWEAVEVVGHLSPYLLIVMRRATE